MVDVLAEICQVKRIHVERRKTERSFGAVEIAARAGPPPRDFQQRLRDAVDSGRYGLIAEIKKASPSQGLIRADFHPTALATAYQAGGATCLSVLTDGPYFQGADEDLEAARAAVRLPVLRKDFTIDAYQVVEARALGADCILVILAAVDDALADELCAAAVEWNMSVLLEIHDEGELARALKLPHPSAMIGINNRDLKTLEVDLAATERLAPLVPVDRLTVGESGIKNAEDTAWLARSGVKCFLIGESLLRQADVTAATAALLGGKGVSVL